MNKLRAARRLMPVGNTLTYVRYFDDFAAFPYSNLWDDTVTSGFGDPKTYVVQTNTKVIERCMLMTTDPGDLVLDPTCGTVYRRDRGREVSMTAELYEVTCKQLEERRRVALARLDISERELRERAIEHVLTPEERDALIELEEIDFLLGDDA